MSKLPDPQQVRALIKSKKMNSVESALPTYDINKIHTDAYKAFQRVDLGDLNDYNYKSPVSVQLDELIDREILNASQTQWFKAFHIGWSDRYKSITFSLFDKEELKAIVIRSATNKDGEVVKWKTYGSKTFTPSKIDIRDKVVFIASGIGEYLLFELMGVSYIALQSDSVLSGITPQMIDEVRGKVVCYLQDNDDSAKALGVKLQTLFNKSLFVTVDFEIVLDRDLPKGYDFRDFINAMAKQYGNRVFEVVTQMIKKEIRAKKEAINV